MSRIKISTLQSKVDFIILALGGTPDQDVSESKRNVNEFEMTAGSIKELLSTCRERLKERTEKIKLYGYQSKERVIADEEIKEKFRQAEDELQYLREVFKRYQEKNKRKISQKEMEARSKNIDLLRKNLNLLQDEFKDQVARMRKDIASQQNPSGAKSADFISVFGTINPAGEEEREELYDEEKDILKQFEENDKELESVAALIVGALDELKGKAQNIESSVRRQGELLKKTRRAQEENEARLRQQNNQLKNILERHKNGRQICLDIALLLIFVGLLGVLIKMLRSKGYI